MNHWPLRKGIAFHQNHALVILDLDVAVWLSKCGSCRNGFHPLLARFAMFSKSWPQDIPHLSQRSRATCFRASSAVGRSPGSKANIWAQSSASKDRNYWSSWSEMIETWKCFRKSISKNIFRNLFEKIISFHFRKCFSKRQAWGRTEDTTCRVISWFVQ